MRLRGILAIVAVLATTASQAVATDQSGTLPDSVYSKGSVDLEFVSQSWDTVIGATGSATMRFRCSVRATGLGLAYGDYVITRVDPSFFEFFDGEFTKGWGGGGGLLTLRVGPDGTATGRLYTEASAPIAGEIDRFILSVGKPTHVPIAKLLEVIGAEPVVEDNSKRRPKSLRRK